MVLKSGMWSIAGSVIEKLLLLSTYVIVSRQVDPVELGYLVLVFLVVELMSYLGGFGVGENVVRQKELTDGFLSSAYRFVSYISLVLVAAMLFLSVPLAYAFSGKDLALLMLSMGPFPALAAFSAFYIALLQREMRFKEIAYRTASISLFSGLVGVTCALSDLGVWSLILAKYAYVVLDLVILKRLTGFMGATSADSSHMSDILSFGWKLSGAQFVNFANSRIYELFVTAIFGAAYLAILDVGRKFIMTFYRLILTPLNGVSLSYFSKQTDPVNSFLIFTGVVGLLVVPPVAIVGAGAEELILLFFGEKWLEASDVLRVLSIGVIGQVAIWFLPSLAMSIGRSDAVLKMHILHGIVLLMSGLIAYAVFGSFIDLISGFVTGLLFSAVFRVLYLRFEIGFPFCNFLVIVFGFGLLYLSFFILANSFITELF